MMAPLIKRAGLEGIRDDALSAHALCRTPFWQGEQLGRPIPPSPHAVSVTLPRWRDVVGYEEKKPEVMERLKSGYPRFLVHWKVEELARELGDGHPCLPFPSRGVAELAASFVRRRAGAQAQVVGGGAACGVATEGPGYTALREFWQHAGLIVSSREAEARLEGRPEPDETEEVRGALRRQLAGWYDCKEDDVFLTPTGMAAEFAALKVALQRKPQRRTIQLGFPYVDTLKLQEKLGNGAIFLHELSRSEARLTKLVQQESIAACFCEVPGNPLLGTPDLCRITPILRAHRVPLVADDVVATAVNVDLGLYADMIATSLTKFVVGTAEAMGGALICNPKSPLYGELKPMIREQHEELLWGEDAIILEQQARTFPERMREHNVNGELVAERLRRHPALERVWYPKWECSEAYEAVRRPGGGWGALLAFLPKNPEVNSPAVYDRLEFCKGPSLGTVFTLACPFTLLAHYAELDWAEACGVSRYLIRVSVGLEDPEEIWRRLDSALT